VEFVKVDSDNPDNVNDTEEVRGAWLEGIDDGNTLGEGEGNAEGTKVGANVGTALGRALGLALGE
jgi:outer membrane lipoprotein SlyB